MAENSGNIGELFVQVRARLDGLERDMAKLNNEMKKDGKKAGKNFAEGVERGTKGLSNFFKGLFAISGAGALLGLIAQLKSATALAIEQAKAEKQVAQAIKQTGFAAGFTAKELFKQASALQALTGVGDEVLLQGVTKQLLTFTNITGESFERAQKAVLDLNAVIAGGNVGSLTSQAIQLGKALEDPIAGIGALSRSGITFTDKQKEMIKSLVEQNRIFEAQSIILSEIEAKYGGQAEALAQAEAGTLQLTAALGDMFERIGAKVLPVLAKLTPALTRFFDSISPSPDDVQLLQNEISEINTLATALIFARDNEKARLEIIKKLKAAYPDFLQQIGDEVTNTDKIKSALDEVNKSYIKRLTVLKAISKEQAAANDIADIQLNIQENLLRFSELVSRSDFKESFSSFFDVNIESVINEGDIDQTIENVRALIEKTKKDLKSKGLSDIEISQIIRARSDISGFIDSIERIDSYQKELKTKNEEFKQLSEDRRKIAEALGVDEGDLVVKPKVKVKEPKKSDLDFDLNALIEKATEQNLFIPITVTPQIKSVSDISEAQEKLFDGLKFEAQGYYDYRVSLIQKEADEMLRAGVRAVDVQSYIVAKNKELYSDFFEWLKTEREKQGGDSGGDSGGFILNTAKVDEGLQTITEQLGDSSEIALAAFDSMAAGFNSVFDEMIISAEGANSVLERVFVDMANTFIAQLGRMTAKLLAFEALKLGLKAFGVNIPTLASGGSIVAGSGKVAGGVAPKLASGGSVKVTRSGYQKAIRAASGGSFIVPQGFNDDSFPILARTGERVTVETANKTKLQTDSMKQIYQTIKALNFNLLRKKDQFTFIADVAGNLKGEDIKLSYDKRNKIERRYQ